jgi:hypothetical protein
MISARRYSMSCSRTGPAPESAGPVILVVKWVVDPELADPYGGAPTEVVVVVVLVAGAGGLG